MRLLFIYVFTLVLMGCTTTAKPMNSGALVLTTDFGVNDGAVSAMKGVAFQVAPGLAVSDLTHGIPTYNIWEAAYRLEQTHAFWPAGTVFVTVVDPGVGSKRRSVVAKARSGHLFVGPDNGHLTLIADQVGFASVRVLDESKQRLKGSEDSYTFHGRDLYAYLGARLASGQLRFEDCGPETADLVKLTYQKPEATAGHVRGMIPVLDPNYGNVWSNIPKALIEQTFPGAKSLKLTITRAGKTVYERRLPLVNTFAGVSKGEPLLYYNSLLNLSVALNMDSFAKRHKVDSGPEWSMTIAP